MSKVCLSYHQWPADIDSSFFHPLRSPYVERFYSPVLGPGCVTVLRRLDLLLAAGITECDDVDDMARELGLNHGRLLGTFERLHRFNVLQRHEYAGDELLAVRPTLPTVRGGQLVRMPDAMQVEHFAVITQLARERGVLST